MAELDNDKICKYCLGCNKLEDYNFKGIRSCKNFAPGYKNWRNMYEKNLQKNLKS